MRRAVERLRLVAFATGCGFLFWQHDAAAVDWLFAIGIAASAALWQGGLPAFDLARPQPLLLLFLTITALATTLAGGSPRFFAITAYLVLLALALASALRRDPRFARAVEVGVVLAGCVTAVTVSAGAAADELGWPFLEHFAYDALRGKGLFKDPNVAGPFLASTYPLAAAYCIGLRRWRLALLVAATVTFAAGVLFSYSRLALLLFVLALAGTMLALAIRRERWLLLGLAACAVATPVALIVVGEVPLYRYQPVQAYDASYRFAAWRFGADMVLDHPLGTGSGSFERRTEEYFEAEARREAFPEDFAGDSENLLRNGAPNGLVGWAFDPGTVAAITISDPTSPTGQAIRKETTAIYQDVMQGVPVVAGRAYSFAAQIRSEGTPALLIIHWRDEKSATIGQAGTDPVTSTSWTEAQLLDQAAPATASHVVVFLSNREPGEQYFAAMRMVEGASAPPWSSSLQWRRSTERPAVSAISAHNAYLRVAAESGLPGLMALSAYLLLLAWSAWRWGRASWQWPLAFSLVLLAGFVIDTLHWRLLWVYAAVVAGSFSRPPVPNRETRPKAQADLGSAVRTGGRSRHEKTSTPAAS